MSETPEITPEAVDAAALAALAAIAAAATTADLKAARSAHSAEGSPLAQLNAQLRNVPNDRKAEFGINLGDVAYQNKGFGTEAARLAIRFGFEELNLNRIGLSVFANNTRAIRCYQKAGFVQEGCLRQAFYRSGQFHDEYRFAILRDEWQA